MLRTTATCLQMYTSARSVDIINSLHACPKVQLWLCQPNDIQSHESQYNQELHGITWLLIVHFIKYVYAYNGYGNACMMRHNLPCFLFFSLSENPFDHVPPRGWKVPPCRSLHPFTPSCWQSAATLWMELFHEVPWISPQNHQPLLSDYSAEAGSPPLTVSFRAAVLQKPTWGWTEAGVRIYYMIDLSLSFYVYPRPPSTLRPACCVWSWMHVIIIIHACTSNTIMYMQV